MSNGVRKSGDLSQILHVAAAAISEVSIKLLQSNRRGDINLPTLCKALLCDNKTCIAQVSKKDGAFWKGDGGKTVVEQLLWYWEHAHK